MQKHLQKAINKRMCEVLGTEKNYAYAILTRGAMWEVKRLGYDVRIEFSRGEWNVALGLSSGILNPLNTRLGGRSLPSAISESLPLALCIVFLKYHGQMIGDEEVDRIMEMEHQL